MNTNQEHRVKNRVNRGLILMYGPVVRSQEALELKRFGSMREADVEDPNTRRSGCLSTLGYFF
jgi:hypothetical protein